MTNASISPWVDSEIFKNIMLPLLIIWFIIKVEHTTRKTEQKASKKWNFLRPMSLYEWTIKNLAASRKLVVYKFSYSINSYSVKLHNTFKADWGYLLSYSLLIRKERIVLYYDFRFIVRGLTWFNLLLYWTWCILLFTFLWGIFLFSHLVFI